MISARLTVLLLGALVGANAEDPGPSVTVVDWAAVFHDPAERVTTQEAGTTLRFEWTPLNFGFWSVSHMVDATALAECDFTRATLVGTRPGGNEFVIPADAATGSKLYFANGNMCQIGHHLTVRVVPYDEGCLNNSDCASMPKCKKNPAACKCKKNKCKKRGVNCKTERASSGLENWSCSDDGMECIANTNERGDTKIWGKCKTISTSTSTSASTSTSTSSDGSTMAPTGLNDGFPTPSPTGV